jgi:hypothetical protein
VATKCTKIIPFIGPQNYIISLIFWYANICTIWQPCHRDGGEDAISVGQSEKNSFEGISDLKIRSNNRIPGANPTIVSYNSSVVKMYHATSFVCKLFSILEKRSIRVVYYNAGDIIVHSEVVCRIGSSFMSVLTGICNLRSVFLLAPKGGVNVGP